MKHLKIRNLRIDERNFSFQPGANVVIGGNGTGKTTIFKCIKHALGMSIDPPSMFVHRLELTVTVGTSELRFTREGAGTSVSIQSKDGTATHRARSASLDVFLQSVFEPKFGIGNKLTSIFPLLEFCFLSDDARPNSRSLTSVFRLICGANDKLIATALRDLQVLHTQIQAEENFLRRTDAFVDDFLRNLGAPSPDLEEKIADALASARGGITRPLLQKVEVLQSSTVRVEELRRQNEKQFSTASREVEQTFCTLLENSSHARPGSLKLGNVISRDAGGFSYGETIFADFLMLLSVARTASFVDLNFPRLYINDGMGIHSLDNVIRKKLSNLLEAQSRDDDEFQYIEFTSDAYTSGGFLVAELDKMGRVYER